MRTKNLIRLPRPLSLTIGPPISACGPQLKMLIANTVKMGTDLSVYRLSVWEKSACLSKLPPIRTGTSAFPRTPLASIVRSIMGTTKHATLNSRCHEFRVVALPATPQLALACPPGAFADIITAARLLLRFGQNVHVNSGRSQKSRRLMDRHKRTVPHAARSAIGCLLRGEVRFCCVSWLATHAESARPPAPNASSFC